MEKEIVIDIEKTEYSFSDEYSKFPLPWGKMNGTFIFQGNVYSSKGGGRGIGASL